MLRDPILELELALQRQAEFQRAAELERLIRAGYTDRPNPIRIWVSSVGDILIAAGLRLRLIRPRLVRSGSVAKPQQHRHLTRANGNGYLDDNLRKTLIQTLRSQRLRCARSRKLRLSAQSQTRRTRRSAASS